MKGCIRGSISKQVSKRGKFSSPIQISPGHFYALGSDATGAAIVWKSVDGGANWNVAWSSAPAEDGSNGFKYDSTLVATGGYLIASPGSGGGCFYRSRDGGQWQKMCSIEGAFGMGVGAPIAEGTGTRALHLRHRRRCDRDIPFDRLWNPVAAAIRRAGRALHGIRAIAGDPEVSGRIYVALAGGGFLVGQY